MSLVQCAASLFYLQAWCQLTPCNPEDAACLIGSSRSSCLQPALLTCIGCFTLCYSLLSCFGPLLSASPAVQLFLVRAHSSFLSYSFWVLVVGHSYISWINGFCWDRNFINYSLLYIRSNDISCPWVDPQEASTDLTAFLCYTSQLWPHLQSWPSFFIGSWAQFFFTLSALGAGPLWGLSLPAPLALPAVPSPLSLSWFFLILTCLV